MAKKVVRKSKSASKVEREPRVVPAAEIDYEVNVPGDHSTGTPKIHAKTVQVIFSVGTYDRENSIEDFIEELRKRVDPTPFVNHTDGTHPAGIHMSVVGSNYILDGKLCRPEDYDSKTQNFKPGAQPPSWAGGRPARQTTMVEQLQHDAATLSSDEYDKKYGLGKFQKKEVSTSVTPLSKRKAAEVKEDSDIEEFDWEDAPVETPKKKKPKIKKRESTDKQPSGKRVVKRGKK